MLKINLPWTSIDVQPKMGRLADRLWEKSMPWIHKISVNTKPTVGFFPDPCFPVSMKMRIRMKKPHRTT